MTYVKTTLTSIKREHRVITFNPHFIKGCYMFLYVLQHASVVKKQ